MQADIDRILNYWLSEIGPDGWYETSDAVDARIRADFLDLWHAGMGGELDHWILSPDGALALLVLLDQFPRNMFRGDAAAFRSDPHALRVAKRAIGQGHDQKTPEPLSLIHI